MPPSTISSQTMSAASSPVCGRAETEFSTLTDIAGRGWTSPDTPVSGHRAGTGLGVGFAGRSTVGLGVVGAGSGSPREVQAVSASSAAAPSATRARRRRLAPAAPCVGAPGSSPAVSPPLASLPCRPGRGAAPRDGRRSEVDVVIATLLSDVDVTGKASGGPTLDR